VHGQKRREAVIGRGDDGTKTCGPHSSEDRFRAGRRLQIFDGLPVDDEIFRSVPAMTVGVNDTHLLICQQI